MALLVGGLLGWSVFASISGAVIASGLVEVESGNQVVEHIDGGTVSEILVRDGDRVRQGDPLLRFSDGRLRSEESLLQAQYAELAARRNRLEAEFQSAEAIVWDEELAVMAATEPRVHDILEGQKRLFQARDAARAGEVARLRERIGQAREEIAGLQAQAASLDEQAVLIDRELRAQRTLFDKGLTRLDRLMAIERAAENLKGRMGSITASIARARGKISELEIQILQIDARHIEEAEEQARDVQAQENQVLERLASVRGSLGRMEVRAPVSGEVFGLAVFAPQEVVRPGEPILQIVPEGAGLVVMARLNPIDEILTNTISHGYDDEEPHRIEIILRLEGATLVVVIVDDSRAFDPTLASRPDIDASAEDLDLGGLGLFLVQQMMDGVDYQRRDGCNVVTLTKSIAAADSP